MINYWVDFYNKNQGLCWGTDCASASKCVMGLWAEEKDKEGKLQYSPTRMEILGGLAKITIEANNQIEELFNNAVRKGEINLPAGAPSFYLSFFSCPSHKNIPLDLD